MKDWKGGIIAEGLSDPTIIGRFSVYNFVSLIQILAYARTS